ncbi:type IV secretory system conjugative DNA transfer family protein [Streptococcus pluranimalium]|uniref:type IV secretory system conjugative DNA transfer family protein n=1 Tax=Streptococcus pluranimalium TaxID=82348 RepID=UPI003F6735E7
MFERLEGLRREIGEASKIIICIVFFLFPFPTFLGSILYFLFNRFLANRRYSSTFIFLLGLIILFFSIHFKTSKLENFELLNGFLRSIDNFINERPFDFDVVLDWFFSLNIISFALSWLFLGLGIFWLNDTRSEIVRKENTKNDKKHKVSKQYPVDLESRDHVLALGTTGSGKTANLLNYIEKRIADNSFVAIIDGKGGMEDYDLYTVVKKLAKKYDRKLYVVNQSTLTDPYASPYNPFDGLSPTQVKDFMIDMSEWESDHYKSLASRYWQLLAHVLENCKIPLTFENLIQFSYRKNALELLDNALKEELITEEMYDRAVQFTNGEEGKQAEISIGRSAVLAEGDGETLFAKRAGWNMRKACEENAVVVVLLNGLKYPDYAKSFGRVAVDDIKALVGQLLSENDNDRKKLIVLEEFGVYADDGMEGLLNRARSAGVQTIVSVQSFADIDKISKELTRQVIGNCNDFLIMLTPDGETAETISSMIGTRKGIEQTQRTDDGDNTGQSSNKIIDQFILHPNDIKQLKKKYGFFYSKSCPRKVIKFKTKFVDI